MYPFCIQAPSNRAVSSCLLLNLSPRAVSGWSVRLHCKYSSSLESVLWLIYIIIYICHLTEFFLNPFIYQLCSKSIIVADINNRSEKMTNKPATLYARISCTRSFLAQRNKVKLIYIRLIWKKKNVFFPQERWKEANLEKHAFLDGFVAFGSGKYQCPGRSVRQPGHVPHRVCGEMLAQSGVALAQSIFSLSSNHRENQRPCFVWLAVRIARCLCENV